MLRGECGRGERDREKGWINREKGWIKNVDAAGKMRRRFLEGRGWRVEGREFLEDRGSGQ